MIMNENTQAAFKNFQAAVAEQFGGTSMTCAAVCLLEKRVHPLAPEGTKPDYQTVTIHDVPQLFDHSSHDMTLLACLLVWAREREAKRFGTEFRPHDPEDPRVL